MPKMKSLGYFKSFANSSHLDCSDCTNSEQENIFWNYISSLGNLSIIKYDQKLRSTFPQKNMKNKIPLPTTCVWTIIEQAPSFNHHSYFVVADTGTSFDLSSNVFQNGYEYLCSTFFGSLVEHVTSCSIWIEET